MLRVRIRVRVRVVSVKVLILCFSNYLLPALFGLHQDMKNPTEKKVVWVRVRVRVRHM